MERNVLVELAIPQCVYNRMVACGTRVKGSLGIDDEGNANFNIHNVGSHHKKATVRQLPFGKVSVTRDKVTMKFESSRTVSPQTLRYRMTDTTLEAADWAVQILDIDDI